MRSHRFYADIALKSDASLAMPKAAAHHCIQVLRYSVGAELTLFNGDGFDYPACITQIEGKHCLVEIGEPIDPKNESPLQLHLYQGIARGDKMDLIIQKSVELGVSQITPLFTERCNVKLDQKRLAKKLEHWQNIAISACEQSGRAIIPPINLPQPIKSLDLSEQTHCLFLEPTAATSITRLTAINNASLFVGPEGGLSELDLQQLTRQGATGITLGPRILRTETAGLICIGILQAQFGDI